MIININTEAEATYDNVRTQPVEVYKNTLLYDTFKSVFDVVSSFFALAVFIVPMIIIGSLIFITTGDKNVIYKQKRIGKHGKEFYMYKFKSMIDTDKPLEHFLDEKQLAQYKKYFKLDDDPRVTRIGRILRKTSLDEFPQLVNVLKRDMSIVGPRPLVPSEYELYGENKTKLVSVIPGITGYWQTNGRNNATFAQSMELQLYYVDNRSPLLDLQILLKTVVVVLKGTGAK